MRRPDTPIGRATRLKPECLQVRVLLWVLTRQWLGRQLADHLGLEPWMSTTATRRCPVRIPPGPLRQHCPRGAAECSPRCQRGDRGFKSHRGRSTKWHGAPIRQSDGFQTSVDVGSTPSRATSTTWPSGLVVVVATLSPWKSRVQIPPGSLERLHAVRSLARSLETT